MTFIEEVLRVQREAARGDSYRFATVLSQDPFVIRLDGDTTATTPAICVTDDVITGDRVWCQLHGTQWVAIGRVQTALDKWQKATLQNGWTNYDAEDSGYGTACFRRDGDHGEICGLVKHATTTTTGTIFTLPAALWPKEARIFIQQSNTGAARINVKENDGTIQLFSYLTNGSGAFVSLEGVRWPLGDTP